MRVLLALLLLTLALAQASPALAKAGPFPPPPEAATWSPGPAGSPAAPALALDAATPAPSGAPSLRLNFHAAPRTAGAAGESAREAGLACAVRRVYADYSGARGLEFSARAASPLVGRMTVESSNVETRASFDRHFGSFVVGRGWRTQRIAFESMAPDPSWGTAEPGHRLLRPDSVEEIRICVEADRLPAGDGTLWIGDIRFFK